MDDVVGSRALSPPQGDEDTSCYVKLPYSTASLSCEEDTLGSPATPPPSPAPLAPLAVPVPDADELNATDSLPWGPTAVLRIRIDGATYRPDLLNIGDIGIYREATPDGALGLGLGVGACTALEPTRPPRPPSPPPPPTLSPTLTMARVGYPCRLREQDRAVARRGLLLLHPTRGVCVPLPTRCLSSTPHSAPLPRSHGAGVG